MKKRNKIEEAEALAEEFGTPARELTSIQRGQKIVEPLLYDKTLLYHQFNELKLQSQIKKILTQAKSSNLAINIDEAITQACDEVGVTRAWADKYFQGQRYKRWYVDRMKEIEDHSGLSVEYLASKHKDNLEGTLKLSSSQLESAKELGDRIWPKVSKIEHEISQKEATTLDDLPDYQKKVDELEEKLKKSLPVPLDAA